MSEFAWLVEEVQGSELRQQHAKGIIGLLFILYLTYFAANIFFLVKGSKAGNNYYINCLLTHTLFIITEIEVKEKEKKGD
jgi:hypothetical protein